MMKNILFFIFCLLTQYSYAQSIDLSEKIYIDLGANITLRDACVSNDQILVVGQDRINGDIDSYLAVLDKQGTMVNSFSLPNKNAYSQFVKIIKSKDGYYVLENSSKQNRAIIKVYHFNFDLKEIAEWLIIEKHSNLGRDLCFLDSENLLVAVWDGYDVTKSYPVIYNLNLKSNELTSQNLDKKNSKELEFAEPNINWTQEQKESFHQLAYYEKTKVVKQVNKLVVNGKNIYVLGSENTDNISDYWMCKLDNKLNIKWEKLYEAEREPGTDWLLGGFVRKDKISLVGYRYNKREHGYDFNYLVSSQSGDIEISKNFDFGQQEIVDGMIEFDTDFIQYGTVLESLQQCIGTEDCQKGFLILLLDLEGRLLAKKEGATSGLQKIRAGLKLNSSSFLLICEGENYKKKNHFFLKGTIKQVIRP